MGLWGFLDKLMDKIPIQGRVERWRNEHDKLTKSNNDLEQERALLQVTLATVEKAKRMAEIEKQIRDNNTRLVELNKLLKNKATP